MRRLSAPLTRTDHDRPLQPAQLHRLGLLQPSEITFGHLLRDAGYATLVAGKWQLWGTSRDGTSRGPVAWAKADAPTRPGSTTISSGFFAARASARRSAGLAQGRGGGGGEGRLRPDLFTDFMLSSIENQVAERPDQPFFAYYPMALTHPPFVPTPDSAGWDGDRYAVPSRPGAVLMWAAGIRRASGTWSPTWTSRGTHPAQARGARDPRRHAGPIHRRQRYLSWDHQRDGGTDGRRGRKGATDRWRDPRPPHRLVARGDRRRQGVGRADRLQRLSTVAGRGGGGSPPPRIG